MYCKLATNGNVYPFTVAGWDRVESAGSLGIRCAGISRAVQVDFNFLRFLHRSFLGRDPCASNMGGAIAGLASSCVEEKVDAEYSTNRSLSVRTLIGVPGSFLHILRWAVRGEDWWC